MRCGRSLYPNALRHSQARPIGFLLAWLFAQHDYPTDFHDLASHWNLAQDPALASHAALHVDRRRALRHSAWGEDDLGQLFVDRLEYGSTGNYPGIESEELP